MLCYESYESIKKYFSSLVMLQPYAIKLLFKSFARNYGNPMRQDYTIMVDKGIMETPLDKNITTTP